MQITYAGHGVDVTDPLREYANKKLQKLERRCDNIQTAKVTFSVEKLRQIVAATLSVKGHIINASAEDSDMYAAIDALSDRLVRQVKEHNEQLKDHR